MSKTKSVVIYSRYSTDLQDEVSIEQQVQACQEFAESRPNWRIVGLFEDRAISGTTFQQRAGIQTLMRRVKAGGIDVVLCVTVDRIWRDSEHGNGVLKRLHHADCELWSCDTGAKVTEMEMGIRTTLSQELIKQIRYRTRMGMKSAVTKGKATTCLSYGYKVLVAHDAKGDRIPGLREVDPVKEKIVVRIFEEYAAGVSPKAIAKGLNLDGIDGPRCKKWRDTAIRGHVSRRTGILNNELYLGRLIWNRRNFKKDPDTEKRVARANAESEWVAGEVPSLRIIDNDLWDRVKRRQTEVLKAFEHTQSPNKLNAAHMPAYMLSGILECAECGGPVRRDG